MDSHRYRLILTGELLPGYSADAALVVLADIFQSPAAGLRGLFDGIEHPVNEPLSAERALDLQSRLDQVGVRCRVERLSGQVEALKIRDNPAAVSTSASGHAPVDPGLMHCPACGHQQLVSSRCESCGVTFSQYNAGGVSAKPEPTPSVSTPPSPAPAPAPRPPQPDDWRDAWVDADDHNEPDERSYLALFFGEQADVYLRHCDRLLLGNRTRFALSWNWGAVFSPFIWALHRKLWSWSMVIFVAEILLPAMFIILGSYEVGSAKLVYLGWAGVLANRLFWPALVNYLYCRHARATLRRLHMMSPNYAAEIDIATAGGTSSGSVLVGLAVAAVMSVFMWSVVDSMHQSTQQIVQPGMLNLDSPSRVSGEDPSLSADVTGVTSDSQAENKWVRTRKKLRNLGQVVNRWLTQNPGSNATQLNLFNLRQQFDIPVQELTDGWGSEVQYIPDVEGYRIISPGPDLLFGTADDIQYRRTLGE